MRRGLKRPVEDSEHSETGSINSQVIQLPLPDDLDNGSFDEPEENLFGGEEGTLPWDGYTEAQPMPEEQTLDQTSVLDEVADRNLKAMVDNSCLSTAPTFKFKMPWERKGMALIFSKKPKSILPTPVMSPIDFDSFAGTTSSAVHPAHSRPVRGCFSDAINFNNTDVSEKDIEDLSMTKALEKWYLIFSTGREAWPKGFDLSTAVRNHQLDDMRLVFGSRSHGTILRRGSSILQFVKWYRSKYFALCPFPTSCETVEDYVRDMQKEGKSSSNLRGFVEAINFCKHVVGMELSIGSDELVSAKVQRLLEVSDSTRKEKVQARVLTVKEVEFLETFLSNERMDIKDRFACGCMLFCLYSRSRWSDIRKVYSFTSDVNEKDGKISGYLECRTRSHKTARLVAKGGLSMPLVAPVWGVTSPPWGLEFLKVCLLASRPLESLDHDPMLAAPTVQGGWSRRAVTTKEAGKWIRNLLASMDALVPFTTIHSLKATPLSWCAKWGLNPECRAVLGHHSTGKTSAECYARDNLAKPLRDFDLVLQQIRTKAFVPDATRSGMVGPAEVSDPKTTFVLDPTDKSEPISREDVQNGTSSSSSSSSESSDESESDHGMPDSVDPVVAPRTWDPDLLMYKNIKSKIVHVVAAGGADTFSCGVRITSDFEEITATPFLDLRKCKRCETARPIKTVERLASRLEKLRKSR